MRGRLLLTVYFKGGRKRPLPEAKRILKHFGKDLDEDYTYSITRYHTKFEHKGEILSSVSTIGLVLTIYVDDIQQGIAHANKLDTGSQISHIDIDVVLDVNVFQGRLE